MRVRVSVTLKPDANEAKVMTSLRNGGVDIRVGAKANPDDENSRFKFHGEVDSGQAKGLESIEGVESIEVGNEVT